MLVPSAFKPLMVRRAVEHAHEEGDGAHRDAGEIQVARQPVVARPRRIAQVHELPAPQRRKGVATVPLPPPKGSPAGLQVASCSSGVTSSAAAAASPSESSSTRASPQPRGRRATRSSADRKLERGNQPCSTEQIGPCELERCPSLPNPTGTITNAGRITVSGGLVPLEMVPNADGAYDMQFFFEPVWASETRLDIRGEGNPEGAPRFHVGLWTPPQFDLVAPTGFAQDPMAPPMPIARGAALDVRWGGAALDYRHDSSIRAIMSGLVVK